MRTFSSYFNWPIVLILLIALVQAQLWLGRGSVFAVHRLQNELQAQMDSNNKQAQLNEQLQSELDDLKQGSDIVEERARMELGMVKPNEIYVQVQSQKP